MSRRSRPAVRARAASSPPRRHAPCRCSPCERLEPRTLLSTINWTNRVLSDNFGVYGANANVARAIVDRAIADWERVIVDFNYIGGGNTYNLDIRAANLGSGTRGGTGGITYDLTLKPTSADITMDDNGGGDGWYFDAAVGTATVPDDGEFTTLTNPFQADAPGLNGWDFYRTIAHEIGHAVGLSSSSVRLQNIDIDIGDDPNDSGSARLFTIDVDGNPGADYTYTNAGGFHLYEGPAVGGNPIHPNELMNSGRTGVEGRRQLISDTITSLLRDAYDYTVTLPRAINTFYANLNTTTNVLTINGDANANGSDNDVIDLEVAGANMSLEVNGSDELIPTAEFTSLTVNAGNGNDDIDVDHLPSGKTVVVNGGAGSDNCDVAIEDDDIDNVILSDFTYNGGTGTDELVFHDTADLGGADTYSFTSTVASKSTRDVTYSSVESIDVNGSNQPSSYTISSILSSVTLSLLAGSGADTFAVGSAGSLDLIDGTLSIGGGGGSDAVTLDDGSDGTVNTYLLSGNRFEQTTGGMAGAVVLLNTTELLTVDGGTAANTWNIPQMSSWINATLGGGGATDTFNVAFSTADLDNNIVGTLGMNGGAGADVLNFFDTADGAGSDSYALATSTLDKPALAAPIVFSSMSDITLHASNNADTINVTGLGGAVEVRGNGGADEINVDTDILVIGTSCVVDTGSGNDVVRVNADNTGLTTVRFAASQTLSELLVGAGGLLSVDSGGNKTLRVNDLLSLGGRINLNDNFFIREAGASIPNLASYTAWLTNGYNGGDWLGAQPSIISSPADASSFSLGYARASAIFNGGGGVFAGQAVTANAIVARFTRYGDANLDGTVNLQDFNRLAGSFGQTGTVWSEGNVNYDNTTNLHDFNRLASNFGQSAAPDGVSGVPRQSPRELRKLLDDVTGGAVDVIARPWSRATIGVASDVEALAHGRVS